MDIPSFIKIAGRGYNVHASSKGYVQIGDVLVEMDDDVRRSINNMPYNEHFLPWNQEMFKVFEQCLSKARKIYREE